MTGAGLGRVWSHCCEFDELVAPYTVASGEILDPCADWAGRWTATWQVDGSDVVSPVRGLTAFPWNRARPVRSFSWRPGQRHRPGLAFMGATGRGHGFESLAERRALTVLDFCGQVQDVLSQPFRLRFFDDGVRREHIPDFLVATAGSTLLIDVRPAHLVKESDVAVFAATGRVAASAGWRYLVVTGWRNNVADTLEVLARGRRRHTDPLGLEEELLAAAVGPRRFGELVAATAWPVLAREVETGFRSGSRHWARPGEPRLAFDPATTTIGERRRAKVAELGRLSEAEAARLGLDSVSERTLQRMAARYRESGLVGLADGRWTRQAGGHPSVSIEVEEAIRAVHEQCLRRSRISMASRERLIHQYVREVFPDRDVQVPHRTTLARVWREWFGPGGSRQRYVRSAAAVPASAGAPVIASRPGQVVVLDSTPLPVKVLDDVFGTPITVHLTIALDAYTHSIVAFRLTPVAESSIEVAMLLRDVLSPLPMRLGWGETMAWPYPGVPAALVADLAGGPVAGLPFFTPEAITVDHGSAFKNHHLVQVARTLGVDVLPARAMRPTDKVACERAFAAIQSLLLELVPGWRGIDVADRGADPESDASWTVAAMEHLLASWIVAVWQNRRLDQHAPAWDPSGRHSPNTLFAAAAARDGISLQIPPPQLYYELLPVHFVKVDARRGVKVGGLWYGAHTPALDPCRGVPAPRGGRHAGKWAVRRDPRDCRQVFIELEGTWHALPWNGLPPEGTVPAFGDARVGRSSRRQPGTGSSPARTPSCCPCCWTCWPRSPRSRAGPGVPRPARRPPPGPASSPEPGRRPQTVPKPSPRSPHQRNPSRDVKSPRQSPRIAGDGVLPRPPVPGPSPRHRSATPWPPARSTRPRGPRPTRKTDTKLSNQPPGRARRPKGVRSER
ncbi:TnsA-like heteromeric transposase endonuclease subunit [Streptomyces sp. ISL-66]|uniref:TnsA-like heteromeric transposase endonuclease subunit n=1 Tax=Streptomyces sp. ISL-66 TaxID=2819186 RepID=UPI001BE7418A|nr:TnsA-like heteromeric transposase endonuclease subunit [Streptomyces sp. ISL-66]MBT2467736.1 TnsA-like heteromeric transposase endonuclease subunit [Streptomyces sp. ISL-66]